MRLATWKKPLDACGGLGVMSSDRMTIWTFKAAITLQCKSNPKLNSCLANITCCLSQCLFPYCLKLTTAFTVSHFESFSTHCIQNARTNIQKAFQIPSVKRFIYWYWLTSLRKCNLQHLWSLAVRAMITALKGGKSIKTLSECGFDAILVCYTVSHLENDHDVSAYSRGRYLLSRM